MKKVLMTNLYFQKYTGSELHTLDLAKQFVNYGYEVTIVVFSKTYPLLAESNGLKIIDITKESLEDTFFDLLFIQHFPVYDYLRCHYEIQYKHMIISKLSSFNGLESLPKNYEKADLISVISQECANTIQEFSDKIFLFTNYATNDHFDAFKNPHKSNPNKIAIISNHVTEELYELQKLMPDAEFQYIGAGNTVQLVNSHVLTQFDLVITIGRTVQQCFACGTPVYVYDCYGGPGFITKKNMELAEANNYSGRGFCKKTSETIKNEILSKYEINLQFIEYLHNYAQEHFSIEKIFKNMLNIAIKDKNEPIKTLSIYSEPERTRIQTYTSMLGYSPYFNNNYVSSSQLYLGIKGELKEENSVNWPISFGYPIKKTFNVKSDNFIRFDPSSYYCKCTLLKVLIDGEDATKSLSFDNASLKKENTFYFVDTDSQILFEKDVKENIYLEYVVEALTQEDFQIIQAELDHTLIKKDETIQRLQDENNRLYLKLHPFKRLIKHFKS